MRISDWSSDVCSSDLIFVGGIGNFGLDSNGTTIVVTDNTAAEGVDTVLTTEVLRFNGVNYGVVTGTGGNNNNLNGNGGSAGSQAVFGLGGVDTINGGTGNDYLQAGAGNDTVTQTGSTGGRDIVDGGAGTDTFVQIGREHV